jgi:hypothetical protein
MNDFDRDNLEFFLSVEESEFDEWMNQASSSEINYAISLIQTHRAELITQEMNLLDDEEDVSEAADLLKKFTLNK